MPFCRFAEGAGMYDVTPIENMFLLEYLPSAPEGFLRVYLYARMLTLHPELGEDIADVARALRMDEESVYNAMTYWERQGLVCRLTDRPPTYQLLSVNGAAASCTSIFTWPPSGISVSQASFTRPEAMFSSASLGA